MSDQDHSQLSPETRCIHGPVRHEGPGVNQPLDVSSAFIHAHPDDPILYPRYHSLNHQQAVASRLASLEGAAAAMLFSSGMSAIATTLLTLLKPGDHAVFYQQLYGGTFALVQQELRGQGILVSLVEKPDIVLFAASLTPQTKLIYVESPSNPLLDIVDLREVAALAKQHGLLSLIDNTFATPINQRPISYGFDAVLHSGTKYLGGHSDLIFGALAASHELVERVRLKAILLGSALNALDFYLIDRSLKTLALRVERQNLNALELAKRLQRHAKVRKVFYPGLPEHPGHAIAASQMDGFGGMLSFEADLPAEHLPALLRRLELIQPAISLGGVESLICVPAWTSHKALTAEERKRAGVSETLLRLSAGVEQIEDLWNDLESALS